MDASVFTHAHWQVRPGQETAFVTAWTALADSFARLDAPPRWGTLLRSAGDPLSFYSFGPWRSADDVERMRADPEAQAAMARLKELCEEATPGLYHVVRHVEVGPASDG